MDTETIQLLAQLMSQAKGGNRNVSSIGNNMSDPLILALAGVLDPYYGMDQGGSKLYNQFANDPSTPAAVKAVMDYVDQGMNKYQIEAQINALDPAVMTDSGFTAEQLISMGDEMLREKDKSKSKDVFAKAGLRNPRDVYSLDDVPLNEKESKSYIKYLEKAKSSERGMSAIDYNIRKAQRKTERASSKSKQAADKAIAEMPYTMAGNDQAMVDAIQTVSKNKYGQGPAKTEDYDAVARAIAQKHDLDTTVQADIARAMAVKKGALNRAASSGRTPFTDQASALMQFIASTK